MNYQPLKYIYKAAADAATANTLLLLHGTGGDENDLLPIARKFGEELNILSLRGNVSESGMPRFFKRIRMGVFDEEDLVFRTNEMVAFIRELSIREGFDVDKIIALGYSNGANIAGSTLILHPDFLAGAILYRSMQPFKIIGAGLKTSKQVPVFMSNGDTDPNVRPAATKEYVQTLKNAGFVVTHHSLAAGHGLTHEDLELSVKWYKTNYQ
jgi:phospholipase/carboxylesterase